MYAAIVYRLFTQGWRAGLDEVRFHRSDIESQAAALGVKLPKNLGDLIYSFRFRRPLPAAVLATAPAGQEWIIELSGNSIYSFRLARISRIRPQSALLVIDLPDATHERLRVFRSCPLITPKGARSLLQMLAIARAMSVLCA